MRMRSFTGLMAAMILAVLAACAVESSEPSDDGGLGGAASGTTTGTAAGIVQGTGAGFDNCLVQPDFSACIECLCLFDEVGCAAYDTGLVTSLACGQTCGNSNCVSFCTGGVLDQGCVGCVNGIMNPNPDLDAFIVNCQADPVCAGFVGQLQSCPN
jgi:hypothetical protein